MKKILLVFAIALMMTTGAQSQAGVVEKLCLYIPNRILDSLDVFTLNLGFGPIVKMEVRATRLIQVGGGIGATAKLIKAYNRQYGAGMQNGWSGAFLMFGAEDTERRPTTRLVQEYWEYYEGFCSPEQKIYNFWDGARDYWAIGCSIGLMLEIDFDIHVVEIADLITGIFFIDLKGDDLTYESFE